MNIENQEKCIIWGTPLSEESSLETNSEKNFCTFNSPLAGGKYTAEGMGYNELNLNGKEKIRLSGWIAKKNLEGYIPEISKVWPLEKLPPIPGPSERAYLLLEGLVKKTDIIGKRFVSEDILNSLHYNFLNNPHSFFYPLSYSREKKEINYLLKYLIELNLIEFLSNYEVLQVTVKGFEKINELSKNVNSKTAFIAMWFGDDDSIKDLEKNIDISVKEAGYIPLIIKNKEHLNKIDDEILNEINKSKLMVCDLTSEKGKARGSVYFEAGYAMGKGIPVVWTCNKELEKEIPFDIRQYNCLFWEEDKMKDFEKKLQNRIENTVGKGPLKGV